MFTAIRLRCQVALSSSGLSLKRRAAAERAIPREPTVFGEYPQQRAAKRPSATPVGERLGSGRVDCHPLSQEFKSISLPIMPGQLVVG